MQIKIIIALSVVVLAVLNYSIYEKERIKKNGETLLLELRSNDPRSLMQGDYMRLRYAIERDLPAKELAAHRKRGYMVIRPDENNVAQFVRFHREESLDEGEKLLRFHKKDGSIHIVPDSFFFQEGHAQYYENARYGVFKFDDSGKHLLIGLAGDDRKIITVTDAQVAVNVQDNKERTALHKGDTDTVRELLNNGADVNARNNDDFGALGEPRDTALHKAARNGEIDMVRELLNNGADVNARSNVIGLNNKLTPLHVAAGRGRTDMVQELLKHGADVNAQTKEGNTALHVAAEYGHTDMVRELLKHGADVNARNNNGETTLHEVARNGRIDMVRELLNNGADIHARDYKGATALHGAAWGRR